MAAIVWSATSQPPLSIEKIGGQLSGRCKRGQILLADNGIMPPEGDEKFQLFETQPEICLAGHDVGLPMSGKGSAAAHALQSQALPQNFQPTLPQN
jgi:hypothetical protein